MEDKNVRANEVEEIETSTEIEEVEDSSNAGALLMGIGGAKKLWAVAEEKYVAKKLAQANTKPMPAETTAPQEAQDKDSGEEPEE